MIQTRTGEFLSFENIESPSFGALHVLIVHFNTPDLTARLVEDLSLQTINGRNVFVHILDNCSTKTNQTKLLHLAGDYDFVTIDLNENNVGFGAGINLLVSNYSSILGENEILWILNPDTRIMDNCVEVLINELELGIFEVISPLICSGDLNTQKIWFCGGSFNMSEFRVQHSLFDRPLIEAPHESFETSFITGAAPMMRVSTFNEVGGFPLGFFLYWEDVYFCWRAGQLGKALGVVPAAQLWHAVGSSSKNVRGRNFYYWIARNRFVFADKVGVRRRQLVLGSGALETLKMLVRPLLGGGPRLSNTYSAFRGTISGLWIHGRDSSVD